MLQSNKIIQTLFERMDCVKYLLIWVKVLYEKILGNLSKRPNVGANNNLEDLNLMFKDTD